MQQFLLPRSGDAPLAFSGERLASVERGLGGGKRLFCIEVYRSTGGQFALAIAYRSTFEEPNLDQATLHAGPQEMVATLKSFDPCACVSGFPPDEHFAAKQARLLADVKRLWAALVSEALMAEVFAERVE